MGRVNGMAAWHSVRLDWGNSNIFRACKHWHLGEIWCKLSFGTSAQVILRNFVSRTTVLGQRRLCPKRGRPLIWRPTSRIEFDTKSATHWVFGTLCFSKLQTGQSARSKTLASAGHTGTSQSKRYEVRLSECVMPIPGLRAVWSTHCCTPSIPHDLL